MPTRTIRSKPLTRQESEPTARGRASDMQGAPLALLPSAGQSRSGVHTAARQPYQSVPVVDRAGKPLMPTTPSRARRWIKSKEATPFFKRGIFCVRLNREPSGREYQDIAVGIDPGSKREGFTVKSLARRRSRTLSTMRAIAHESKEGRMTSHGSRCEGSRGCT